MKDKILINIKKVYRSIIEYIITNRLFISYFILALFSTILVRSSTIGDGFSFLPLITDAGLILIVGAIGYFIKPKNQFKYYFTWLIIINLICLIGAIYYRFFTSFASIGEFSTIGQTETVTGSIFDRLSILDSLFIVIPIAFYFIHNRLLFSNYYYFASKFEKGKKIAATTIFAGVLLLAYSFGLASDTDYGRLAKQWNRPYIVKRFGIILYQGNDVAQFLSPKINSLFGATQAEETFNAYFDAKEEHKKNKYTGILKGKNVVFIHMEGMQTFLMNLSFNGEEATPNLNKLAKEGMFFKNFYPQISTGTSSDTEFTLQTGLMPAASGVVFTSYFDRDYLTIAKYLKKEGYYTYSMHGNFSSMWNRNRAHPSLGYEGMYFEESFNYDKEKDVINLGINDRKFFEQGVPIMENIEKNHNNYMATIITLSNHSPFKLASPYSSLNLTSTYETVNELGQKVVESKDYLSDSSVGKYIKSANYADLALGDFINYINKSNCFNDTVFVFYGDHDAKLNRKEINYLYNLSPETGEVYEEDNPNYKEYDNYDHELNKKTPLIIWTKNRELKRIFKGEITYNMGMYNIAPTILNMYGIDNKYTIGEDIFNTKEDNMVIFPSGNILTKDLYYNNSTGEYKSFSGKKVEEEHIKNLNAKAENMLEVSNSIIVYDLLKKYDLNGE